MGEKVVNGFLLLCSMAYLSLASTLSFGSMSYPKAGFIPTIVGSLATIITALLFIKSLRGKGDAKDVKLDIDLKKSLLLIAVLLLYIGVMMLAGFIAASFITLLAIFKICAIKGWLKPIMISLVGSVGFYLIFDTLLGVKLP